MHDRDERNRDDHDRDHGSVAGLHRVKVASFYKFVALDDVETLRASLMTRCEGLGLKGTILLAREGINATLSGEPSAIDDLIAHLRADPRFADLAIKYSQTQSAPFQRLKVKIKSEIVKLAVDGVDPASHTGQRVSPKIWNSLISDPEVTLIDTRNDYEVSVGTFPGAINPSARAFGEFPDFVAAELAGDKSRKIAMFCTGGIRCEKASAYLLQQGFSNVYQLDGGILNYLEQISPEDSLWRGECFVFDDRVALKHDLASGDHTLCSACGAPFLPGRAGDVVVSSRCPDCREPSGA